MNDLRILIARLGWPYLTKCVNSWQSDETLESFPVIGLHTNRWPILIVTTSAYLSGETPII